MDWHINNALPIYAQLVAQIKRGIVSGAYAPGERLSSVRDMAEEAGVNPNTMQRALQELEREGLVFSQRTSGRFVTEDAESIRRSRGALARQELRRFQQAMRELGITEEEILQLLEESREKEEET